MPELNEVEALWRELLTTGEPNNSRVNRHMFRLIPSSPRCQICNAPFTGFGGFLMRNLFGKRPSHKNPKFCGVCEEFTKTYRGGAEIELTMLFADVRGSTTIAESISPADFSRLLNRFYAAANKVLVDYDAFIDKMVGDEVIGHFLPGYAGPEHAHKAVHAALDLLTVTGHGGAKSPWLPVGVGIHTGRAYFGTVGSLETVTDVTALGDAVNVTARLASAAGAGEILLTERAAGEGGIETTGLELRKLDLKGRAEPVAVWVMKVGSHIHH